MMSELNSFWEYFSKIMVNVKLYNRDTIDSLPWPDNDQASYAKKYIVPFIKNGSKHYIDNVETTMMALHIDSYVLPVTINDSEYENSHVCSPYTQYVTLALKKLLEIENVFLRVPLASLVRMVKGFFLKGKLNKAVMVNNWLVTTNLYPELNEKQINAITQELKSKFPEHAIIFRSVHDFGNKSIKPLFQKSNYDLIASRQVFFTDTEQKHAFLSRMFKSDLKLLKTFDYAVLSNQELSESDISQLHNLYFSLYHKKHTSYSPQLNHNFFKLMLENNLFTVRALRVHDRIEAIMAYTSTNGMVTSPMFGYDVDGPKSLDLYRILSTILLLEAKEKKLILNHSSGAASYKKLRRAEPSLEYMAVSYDHLPRRQRFSWLVLSLMMSKIGIHVMKRF